MILGGGIAAILPQSVMPRSADILSTMELINMEAASALRHMKTIEFIGNINVFIAYCSLPATLIS
jgi:hypothetical protein